MIIKTKLGSRIIEVYCIFCVFSAHLTSLSLAGNQLREFPSKALKPIHELTTLHMDDNKISILNERAFEGFGEHIKFLWLQNNQ